MVRLNKIYTRTGDDGTTGLAGGKRQEKCSFRICAIGEVDETNSCIGVAIAQMRSRPEEPISVQLCEMLTHIQNDLFDLGADLATLQEVDEKETALRISEKQILWIEENLDLLNATLSPLNSFILPGGTLDAAALHLARAVARRAERAIVQLFRAGEEGNPLTQQYLNRLSDFLFVAARCLNAHGKSDILWKPAAHR